jgi:putative effector of murein hydrolase LrgA (UPF0299 family)
MDNFRILMANTGSWCATFISFSLVEDVLKILVLLGSLSVSIVSIWWIAKQARALEKKGNKDA